MISFLGEWAAAIWLVLCMSGPYLLLGFAIAGLIKAVVPESWIFKHIGKDNFRSVFVASCCGVPIPLCSCSVIPTAISLKRSGASKGATTSFLISTPETGVDSIGVTYALMDPLMTIVRPLAALLTALGAGQLVNVLVRRGLDDDPVDSSLGLEGSGGDECCEEPGSGEGEGHGHEEGHGHGHGHGHEEGDGHGHGHEHDHEHEHESRGGVLRRAWSYAFGTLLDDLTPWFILGFLVSGLIAVLVPDDFFGGTLTPGWMTMGLMLVIGVPMYICATASTPVAAALVAKGLDPGAALVLLLAGPATNIATVLVVKQFLGKRVLGVYLASIAFFSLLFGWTVNQLYTILKLDTADIARGADPEALGWVTITGGVILSILLLISAVRQDMMTGVGARLRRWCAPLGFDPTSRLAKTAGVLLVLAIYGQTAYTVIGPGQTGFHVRFGEVIDTYDSEGVRLHAPYPIDRVEVISTGRVRSANLLDVWQAELDGGPFTRATQEAALAAAEVITGDEYLLQIEYAVNYRVGDAFRYRFGVSDPQDLLLSFTESALRETMARHTSEEVLVGHWTAIETEFTTVLQEELERLDAGITVVGALLMSVHAPDEVHESFRDVASAQEDKERRIRRAERYQTERLAEARGSSYRIVEEAKSAKATAIADATGEVAGFAHIAEAYQGVTGELNRLRRRLEAAELSLDGPRLVLVLDDDVEVVLWKGASSDVPPPTSFGEEGH